MFPLILLVGKLIASGSGGKTKGPITQNSAILLSKLQSEALREAITQITTDAKEKKHNFTKTIELQIRLKNYDPKKDKCFSGIVKLPHIPRPKLKVLPPSNVTGALHIGHALTAAIQIVLPDKGFQMRLKGLQDGSFPTVLRIYNWFAWHVEDHELHSLNFLHIGSPKTWYAVPGDYAFTFEEVICSKAYGGGVDRLASLTLLGEKTTLLSLETVVASGIPCCRLVQNSGEFVVTFPRAYHIGFSHGFNCGEAANFGTPKWLSVAKETAVRRDAMNFLPMLSHQQLLYLLTMVPRSLLPGIRSSRLKDRLKEECELLVKKEFIEDILKENKLLTCILNRSSSYHAVLWDLESLSPSVINNSTIINPQTENFHVEKDNEKLVHVEDEDMSSDFQIDSGTLPRILCLEHASKVEELLDSIGGAKLLIICHLGHHSQFLFFFFQ
ncbi:unnamed protein product [Lactuca virosa]|uniref:JmjC domain-containing protein n=1 Tax=Lactuca virosa TaxID=75947 RepID=A0AAU9P746_9ASTR|nr:unnamed protein product [Lactuca virosa]